MKKSIYGIFDNKLEDLQEVFFRPTDSVAIREFADLVNDTSEQSKHNPLCSHFEDFKLVKIGTLDSVKGLENDYRDLIQGKDCKIQN